MSRIGRWQLLGEVARGGMGSVHRAQGPDGRPVALKLLLAGKGASPLARRRIATEVQALLRLRHENVVALLDAGEHEGVPWLVTDWVEGETLASRLERDGPFDPRAAVELIQRLAAAVDHCHAQGVLHRDLKPDNVLLRASDGAPLLTDFGISKDVEDMSRSGLSRTTAGRWLGTPGWWPPEQAQGRLELIGPRSDVYGLGALLYAALTGCPPQEGRTLQELLSALERPPVPPGRRRPGIPAWLDAVCLRALARVPAGRQPSAGALARELAAGATGRGANGGIGLPVLVAVCLVALGGSLAALIAVRSGPGELTQPAHAAAEPAPVPSATRSPHDQLVLSGVARYQQGDLAGALRDLDEAIALEPESAMAWGNRGLVRAALGDPRGGLVDLDRAIALDPHNAIALNTRGVFRRRLGDQAGGRADFDRAIELSRDYPEALGNRGMLLLELGEIEPAREDLRRAAELAPHVAANHFNLALLLHDHGDPVGALREYDRALELDPDLAAVRTHRGRLRAQLGDRSGALADLDRALALDPNDPSALNCRGMLRREDDLHAALADLDRAIQLSPEFQHAWLNRGLARQDLGDLQGALADFERAVALVPADPAARRHLEELRALVDEARPVR